MKKVIVVGAGIGGLTAAISLAQAGHQVDLLEAHIYPAGCAGQFFHKGYRFDAGATLAGGFAPNAAMDLIGQKLGINWAGALVENGMSVHLPDGTMINRYTDDMKWKAERFDKFGVEAEPFWAWQEKSADALWQFALSDPRWPPQTVADFFRLVEQMGGWINQLVKQGAGISHLVQLATAAFGTVQGALPIDHDRLRLFLDGQLLISAQATTQDTNRLFAAAALDLTRQGVAHFPRGVGQIGEQMVDALRLAGGAIHYRQEAVAVTKQTNGRFLVQTKKGDEWEGDHLIFNLPPTNIHSLVGSLAPPSWQKISAQPVTGWGAFMVYVGVDATILPDEAPLHHQLILEEPLGEGNSLFLSFSAAGGHQAPEGRRALTMSTHTEVASWWALFEDDRPEYERRKEEMCHTLIDVAERLFPDLREKADLILPGTPITFQRYTKRRWGWVGGFPQTNLWRNWGPRIAPNLWMVGDTIFPGQSIPATAMGGLRVAGMIQEELG